MPEIKGSKIYDIFLFSEKNMPRQEKIWGSYSVPKVTGYSFLVDLNPITHGVFFKR